MASTRNVWQHMEKVKAAELPYKSSITQMGTPDAPDVEKKTNFLHTKYKNNIKMQQEYTSISFCLILSSPNIKLQVHLKICMF